MKALASFFGRFGSQHRRAHDRDMHNMHEVPYTHFIEVDSADHKATQSNLPTSDFTAQAVEAFKRWFWGRSTIFYNKQNEMLFVHGYVTALEERPVRAITEAEINKATQVFVNAMADARARSSGNVILLDEVRAIRAAIKSLEQQ